MDETSSAILQKLSREGGTPRERVERLLPNEIARLAAVTVGHLRDDTFDAVCGIAFDGILFSTAIAGGRPIAFFAPDGELHGPSLVGKSVLIAGGALVDSVPLERAVAAIAAQGGKVVGIAAVLSSLKDLAFPSYIAQTA